MNDHIPIISITGTKGKTTTAAVIADVAIALKHNVLKVDTTGHFLNGERRSTLEDSKATWRLVPSVCAGRYLYEFHLHPELRENAVAVLECSLGSSASSGLGYRYHKVGVFLNVFEDHLGSSPRIQSREDIAKAKEFIFTRITKDNGVAVFNADDKLVVSSLKAVPKTGRISLLPVGMTFSEFNLEEHLNNGGVALTINADKQIVLRASKGDTILADLTAIPWTFNGTFTPSVWNILSAVGALYGLYGGKLPEGFKEAVESVRLDKFGGRLTLLKAENGTTILADYAHEKVSLQAVAGLARTITKGRVIGVVRLAHDRTDTLMRETGEAIGKAFDEVIVYEKIDGYWRKARAMPAGSRFPEVVGRTSEILAEGAASVNSNVTRILREDEALAHAAKIARPDDVVVVIVNDDIRQSIGFVKDTFKADFV